jgi:hypothetical protein
MSATPAGVTMTVLEAICDAVVKRRRSSPAGELVIRVVDEVVEENVVVMAIRQRAGTRWRT